MKLVVLACMLVASAVDGLDDGLARTPPMGWRDWNAYRNSINQTIMEMVMDKMVDRSRGVSLLDLGYKDVGLDDSWQACGKGVNGSFHNKDGVPIVDTVRFPDLKRMTAKAKRLGLTPGFYLNNCDCREQVVIDRIYDIDAKYVMDVWDFDSVKLDNCGPYRDLDRFLEAFRKTNKEKILIENCHWGLLVPTETWCPFHMYRTSKDISANWVSLWMNIQSTRRFQSIDSPLSRPGCWAYPDMLEVGRLHSYKADRSHFGLWVITSSPLILGFDLLDTIAFERTWDIISNKHAIAVNQAWFGHPGLLVESINHCLPPLSLQVWAKPLSSLQRRPVEIAVLVVNGCLDKNATVALDLAKVIRAFKVDEEISRDLFSDETTWEVFDIWTSSPRPSSNGKLNFVLEAQDSTLLRIKKVA